MRNVKRGGPYLPAIGPYTNDAYRAAGLEVDPKTGKVYMPKFGECALKEEITRTLELIDRQDYCNRFSWYNLPSGLTGNMVENMLYHRGNLCFFYDKTLNKFFMLPYALDGNIDVYGRFVTVHPLPYGSTSESKEEDKTEKQPRLVSDWLSEKKLRVIYEPLLPEEVAEDPDIIDNCCVLLHDHTPGLSQIVQPRRAMNRGIIGLESDLLPYMRTALLNSTGVRGIRVQSTDDSPQVKAASKAMNTAAINGEKYIPIVGSLEFQDLTDGSVANAEEFLLAMQSVDNFRISSLGIANGGLFQKKQQITDSQASVNGGTPSMTRDDCTFERQQFCDIVNSIWWGLGVACTPSESALGVDTNMDGVIDDEQDQSGVPGEQPANNEEGQETE